MRRLTFLKIPIFKRIFIFSDKRKLPRSLLKIIISISLIRIFLGISNYFINYLFRKRILICLSKSVIAQKNENEYPFNHRKKLLIELHASRLVIRKPSRQDLQASKPSVSVFFLLPPWVDFLIPNLQNLTPSLPDSFKNNNSSSDRHIKGFNITL